ncbi:RGS domain-containing protein [Microdochium trichocladiopsis]|uniref:RGS domain-containing protein n=1 Tax=Microdochium trichocladiopsis TaxID=1682393 RepID=A0A9P9BL16_9PEZI|nr:RGS domain-containing protein [Microdochium trichocladiopsis]KAH7021207.1 RGS domain-containing protein [Microdochium trichocladiopsis]
MGLSSLRETSSTFFSSSRRAASPPTSVSSQSSDMHSAMNLSTGSTSSRGSSMFIPRVDSPTIKAPSLAEILANTAQAPWTLSAFMAYLSQNHCMETLEFILDAGRYRTTYEVAKSEPADALTSLNHLSSLWDKLIDAYILPSSPREVNLPAYIRDSLLRQKCRSTDAPHPSKLDDAVNIVHELMQDSLLVPFVESMVPALVQSASAENLNEQRQSRSMLRHSQLKTSDADGASQSPKSTFLPLFTSMRRGSPRRSSAASMEVDDALSEDTATPQSAVGADMMTPPTTPPTADYAFPIITTSVATHSTSASSSWKDKIRLGLGKKNKTGRRPAPTSGTAAPVSL